MQEQIKFPLKTNPDLYFIIRPSIDRPQLKYADRACLYIRRDGGDLWLSNMERQGRAHSEIQKIFDNLIFEKFPEYYNDKNL